MVMDGTGPVTGKLLFVPLRGLSINSHAHANSVEVRWSIEMPRAPFQGVSELLRIGGQKMKSTQTARRTQTTFVVILH